MLDHAAITGAFGTLFMKAGKMRPQSLELLPSMAVSKVMIFDLSAHSMVNVNSLNQSSSPSVVSTLFIRSLSLIGQ